MPREAHIERQVHWKTTLQKYGCKVTLEKTVHIRNAPVIVDVFAEVEGKKYLIEMGDIADKRKNALMQFYAEQNFNIEFIHEGYGENKIPTLLESVTSYQQSPEYDRLKKKQQKLEEIKENRLTFNVLWTGFCIFAFIFCFAIPVKFNALSFLMAIGFLMPFLWFFILIVGNRRYTDKERIISDDIIED